MATLAAAVSATATTWTLDEELPAGTRYLRVGDELVALHRRGRSRVDVTPDPLVISVKRGIEGTAAVAHDSGTTVEPHVDAYATPTPFAVGGGEQKIRLLGPFRVNFDDDGLEPDGAGVLVGVTLEPNTHVIAAWIGVLTVWNNAGTTPRLNIDFRWEHANGEDQPGNLGEALFSRNPTTGSYGLEGGASGWPVVGAVGPRITSVSWAIGPVAYFIRDTVEMVVQLISGGSPGTPSQGAADIYALIAEPAE